jgi:Na+-driven multidrug efflux pump
MGVRVGNMIVAKNKFVRPRSILLLLAFLTNVELTCVFGFELPGTHVRSIRLKTPHASIVSYYKSSRSHVSLLPMAINENGGDDEIPNSGLPIDDGSIRSGDKLNVPIPSSTSLSTSSVTSSSSTSSLSISKKSQNGSKTGASKREMLKFALPALGIYLANPLLSNIDNGFVGQTVGTQGLAALSPATICTDQMIYLFSFLSRATTGLVSRAYGSTVDPLEKQKAASEAGSAPLTVALICGIGLSIMYAFCTPTLLALLNVTPGLRGSAASYVYWRGAVAWAALAQGVSLSVMMATQDSITPLKIIGLAAIVNVIGDFLLCVWPIRGGVSGAAAATALSTLVSSGFMVRALKRKGILPKIRFPSRKELLSLTEFTGPLMAITITRLIGFVSMQRAAMALGVKQTAAYQVCVNLVIFFLLFGEPLSQLSQTQLPALIDREDGPSIRANLKSVLALGTLTSLGIGTVAGLTIFFGSPLFSSDVVVQQLAREASSSVFLTVAIAIFAGTTPSFGVKICTDRNFLFVLYALLTCTV